MFALPVSSFTEEMQIRAWMCTAVTFYSTAVICPFIGFALLQILFPALSIEQSGIASRL